MRHTQSPSVLDVAAHPVATPFAFRHPVTALYEVMDNVVSLAVDAFSAKGL